MPFVVELRPGHCSCVNAGIYVGLTRSAAAESHPNHPVAIDWCRRRGRHAAVEGVVDRSLCSFVEFVADVDGQNRA